MKNNLDFLANGIGLVDDDLLKEAETPLISAKTAALKRILPIAACFLLLCGILTASLVIGKKAAGHKDVSGGEKNVRDSAVSETTFPDPVSDALSELLNSLTSEIFAKSMKMGEAAKNGAPMAEEMQFLYEASILQKPQPEGKPYLILVFSDGSAYLPLTEDEFNLLLIDLKTSGEKPAFGGEWKPAVPVLLADGSGNFYSPYIENAADNVLTEPETPAFEVLLPSAFAQDAAQIIRESGEK